MSYDQQLSTAHLVQAKLEEEEANGIEPIELKASGCTWTVPLTVICCFFVVISLLGAYSSACGFHALMQKQEVTNKIPRTKAERQLKKIEETAIAAREKYFPLLLYLEVVKLALAAGFMFGMVLLVARNPMARNFVIGLCGGALFYHLCAMIIMFLMMSATGTVFNSVMDDVFNASNFNSAEDAEIAREYVTNQFFTFFTIAISILLLIRLAFYGTIMAYLWSDEVKKIFGEDPLAHLAKEKEEADAKVMSPA